MRYVSNPPDAAALMTSARSFGNYELSSAIADLIDNSITAKAHNISITCLYNDGNPKVSIRDDGGGMTESELLDAMRPASTNPLKERSPDDLGRFGWGLKSASFSQCTRLTVLSRKGGHLAGAVWDIEAVDDWRMGILSQTDIREAASSQLQSADGTEVIWENCDRLSEDGHLKQAKFNQLIVRARDHLALTFHRFLSGPGRKKLLTILLNGTAIEPFDPFHRDNPATQRLETEPIKIQGARIPVEAFILPHYSKLKLSDYERLAGEEGLLKNQGFYVYRQHRLIIAGTWFRLVKNGELSQLVRISIDIPNTLDKIWKITLDKSDAQLPAELHGRLEQIANSLRKRSSRVIRGKGARLDRKDRVPVWVRIAHGGRIRYELNREHPLIQAVQAGRSKKDAALVKATLDTIEQSVPVMDIGKDASQRHDDVSQIAQQPAELMAQLNASLPAMLLQAGGNLAHLATTLKRTEPYAQNWNLVQDYLQKKGWLDGKA